MKVQILADTTHVSPAIFVTTTALLAFGTRPYGILHPANRPTSKTSPPSSLRRSILSRTVSFRDDLSLRLTSSSEPSMAARIDLISANSDRFTSLFLLAASSQANVGSCSTGKGASLEDKVLLLTPSRKLGERWSTGGRLDVLERWNKARQKPWTFAISASYSWGKAVGKGVGPA